MQTAANILASMRPVRRPVAAPELTPEQHAAEAERQAARAAQCREEDRLRAAQPAAEAALVALKRRHEHRLAWLDSVPKRFQGARLADLAAERKAALVAWLDDPARPWCAVLSGGAGRGKTHGAIALGHEVCRRHRAVRFVSWLDYLMATRKAAGGGAEPPAWQSWPGVVILDDIGTGTATPFASELLLSMIGGRESELLPTIITSNGSLTDFGGIDGRLASRLSGAAWLIFGGSDLRPDARPQVLPVSEPAPVPELTPENVRAEIVRQGLATSDWRLFGRTLWEARRDNLYGTEVEALVEALADWPALLRPWHEVLAGVAVPPGPGVPADDLDPRHGTIERLASRADSRLALGQVHHEDGPLRWRGVEGGGGF